MNDTPVEIHLVAEGKFGEPSGREAVPAWPLGGERYRLAASPGFAPGVAKGDVIELDPADRWGYRIIERSGLVAVRLFFRSLDAAQRERVVSCTATAGGEPDGGMDGGDSGCLLIFNFELRVGFHAIEAAVAAIERDTPQFDGWHYANIYDNDDGLTSLDWWLA